MSDDNVYGNASLWTQCAPVLAIVWCALLTWFCAKDRHLCNRAGVQFAEQPAVGVVKQDSSVSGHRAHLCTTCARCWFFGFEHNPVSVNSAKWVTIFVLTSKPSNISKMLAFGIVNGLVAQRQWWRCAIVEMCLWRDLALEVKILTKRGYFTVSDSHQLFPRSDALFRIEILNVGAWMDNLDNSKRFQRTKRCLCPAQSAWSVSQTLLSICSSR